MDTPKADAPDPPTDRELEVKRSSLPGIVLALLATPIVAGFAVWWISPSRLATVLVATDAVTASAARLLWPLVALLGAAIALYPPLLPGLRLFVRRLGRQLSFDRKVARDLVQRLAQLETARDLQSLGQLYLDAAQPRHALPHLLRASELEPASARLRYLLGRCLFELGQLAPAEQQLQQAVALEPGVAFGEALLLAAHVALRIGNPELAAERAARHGTLFGESIRGLQLAARAAHRLRHHEERNEHLRRLLAMPPGMGKRYSTDEAMARARARVARATGGEP